MGSNLVEALIFSGFFGIISSLYTLYPQFIFDLIHINQEMIKLWKGSGQKCPLVFLETKGSEQKNNHDNT